MNEKRALIAIVNFNGKILVGKKRSDSSKFFAGEWHVPGETTEGNESDEQALIRGIKEEVGLNIRVGNYIASHVTPTSKREARWYECFADSDKIIVGSDLEDAKFIERNEVLNICGKRVYSFWSEKIIKYFSK